MKNRHLCIVFAFFTLLVVGACAPVAEKAPVTPSAEESGLSAEEQNKLALAKFEEILEISSSGRRRERLPEIEAVYTEIIRKYPKSPLAQESWFSLFKIVMNDYAPPKIDRGEEIYREFIVKYPDSQFASEMEDMIATAFQRSGKWEQLLKFTTPAVRNYIKTGKMARPMHMFMYSEAKLNMGETAEAEKGFWIVVDLFPKSREAEMSKNRLRDLKTARSQQKKQ